jgi:hypothetical protein
MRRLLFLCSALALAPWSAAVAELPYTFQAGDPIRASELNANFQYLESLGSGGEFETLTRRRVVLSSSGVRSVVTVPDSATNGWVLRYYATNCGAAILRIDNDPEFPLANDAPLVVRAGETLYARCASSSSGTSLIGYFMFNEQ